MALTVEAIYEDGVLKPKEPLPLEEHQQVQITIHPHVSRLADCYGMMGFTGTAAEAEYFSMDSELDYPAPPEMP